MSNEYKSHIDNITFDNTLSAEEQQAIDALLHTEMDPTTLHEVVSTSCLQVAGSETMSMQDMMVTFDTYVEEGDSWRLVLKDASSASAPAWVKNIIDNPKNNDLAYFIQRISSFLKYSVARGYGRDALDKVNVHNDKIFGKQTKRALDGLKQWVTAEKLADEGVDLLNTFITKEQLDAVLQGKAADEQKNILDKLHLELTEETKEYTPQDGYTFIDEHGDNYAVKEKTEIEVVDGEEKTKTGEEKTDTGVDDPQGADEPVETTLEEATETKEIGNVLFQRYFKQFGKIIGSLNQEQKQGFALQIRAENPSVKLSLKQSVIPTGNRFKNFNFPQQFNLRTYITADNKLDSECIKSDLLAAITRCHSEMETDVEEIKKRTNMMQNEAESIKNLRSKTYTLKELFKDSPLKVQDESYKAFFAKFRDNKLLIDKNERYVRISDNDLYLRFDQKGFDDSYVKNLTVPKSDVLNEDGTINDDKLKATLAKLVTDIVEEPKNGYIA